MATTEHKTHAPAEEETGRRNSISATEKGRWERLWPVIACGAGLFSDGYLNNVRLPTRTVHMSSTLNSGHIHKRHF